MLYTLTLRIRSTLHHGGQVYKETYVSKDLTRATTNGGLRDIPRGKVIT